MPLSVYFTEYIFLLFVSLFAISIFIALASLPVIKFALKNKNKFTKTILVTISIVLITNTIGWISWNLFINDKLIEEADPWITSIPYKAISWEPAFIFDYEEFSLEERMESLYYKPLPPLNNLTQVSIVSHIFSVFQIIVAYLLSMLYVFKKLKDKKYYLFISLVFLLQICFLGLTSLLNIFK